MSFLRTYFVSKVYLKCAGKFKNCRSVIEMVMECEKERVKGEKAPRDVVAWERDFHLSFILFSNSGTTQIAYSVSRLPLLLTFSLTISTS